MELFEARVKARKLSREHHVWYVRRILNKEYEGSVSYEPWAHSSFDKNTVATFILGNEYDINDESL